MKVYILFSMFNNHMIFEDVFAKEEDAEAVKTRLEHEDQVLGISGTIWIVVERTLK